MNEDLLETTSEDETLSDALSFDFSDEIQMDEHFVNIDPSIPVDTSELQDLYYDHFDNMLHEMQYFLEDTAGGTEFYDVWLPEMLHTQTFEWACETAQILIEHSESNEDDESDDDNQEWSVECRKNIQDILQNQMLKCFTRAQEDNPYSNQRMDEITDLPLFKIKQPFLICCTDPLHYKKTSACFLKILNLVKAYRTTYNRSEMKKIRYNVLNGVEDYIFQEPFYSVLQTSIKERIGQWMIDHRNLWQNKTSLPGAPCSCFHEPPDVAQT